MLIERPQPTAVSYLPSMTDLMMTGLALTVVTALGVGTGGASTFEFLKGRGSKGYPYAHYEMVPLVYGAPTANTPSENLSCIRDVLHPSVTDLANALSVSRQAIYDWQAGKPIARDNAAKLASFAQVAHLFLQEGLTASPQVLRRPIFEGKSLLDIIREGGSTETAARTLFGIIRRETHQRDALRARLSERRRPGRESYDDIGAPMLDEKG